MAVGTSWTHSPSPDLAVPTDRTPRAEDAGEDNIEKIDGTSSVSAGNDISSSASASNKKPRHRHTPTQLAALNGLYERNEHPSLDERTSLAEKLGMETKTVNAWFQNKRASNKKRNKGPTSAAGTPVGSALARRSPSPTSVSSSVARNVNSSRKQAASGKASGSAHAARHSGENDSSLKSSKSNPETSSRRPNGQPSSKSKAHSSPYDLPPISAIFGSSTPPPLPISSSAPHVSPVSPNHAFPPHHPLDPHNAFLPLHPLSVTRASRHKRTDDEHRHDAPVESQSSVHHSRRMIDHDNFDMDGSSSLLQSSFFVGPPLEHRFMHEGPSLEIHEAVGIDKRDGMRLQVRPQVLSNEDTMMDLVSNPKETDKDTNKNRLRQRPSAKQTDELRRAYNANPHPSKDEREELGDRIGMRYQSVTNWFQNQRSLAKKRKEEEDDGDSVHSGPSVLSSHPEALVKEKRPRRSRKVADEGGNYDRDRELGQKKEERELDLPSGGPLTIREPQSVFGPPLPSFPPHTHQDVHRLSHILPSYPAKSLDHLSPPFVRAPKHAGERLHLQDMRFDSDADHPHRHLHTHVRPERSELSSLRHRTNGSGASISLRRRSTPRRDITPYRMAHPHASERAMDRFIRVDVNGTQNRSDGMEVVEARDGTPLSRTRRTRPEPFQLAALKKLFLSNANPSIEERSALALELSMDVSKVTNWFRNLRQTARKRAKENGVSSDQPDAYPLVGDEDMAMAMDMDMDDEDGDGSDGSGARWEMSSASSASHDREGDDREENMDLDDEEGHDHDHGRQHRSAGSGSEEDYREPITPSPDFPSSYPPAPYPPTVHSLAHPRSRAQSGTPIDTGSMDHMSNGRMGVGMGVGLIEPNAYAELEKAVEMSSAFSLSQKAGSDARHGMDAATTLSGVKIEDALLLLSFHKTIVH